MEQIEKSKVTGARRHRPECMCRFCIKLRAQAQRAAKKPPELPRQRYWTGKKERFVREFSDPQSPGFNNASQASILAGYSRSHGDALLAQPQVKNGVIAAMERLGIDDKFLAEGLKEGLRAEDTRFFSDKGIVTDERRTPDHHARAKFQDMTYRLRGDYPKDEVVQQAALILKIGSGPVSPEEWEVIAAQERARKVGPQGQDDPGDDGR